MKSLFNPGNLISSILSPITSIFGGEKPAIPSVTTPGEDKAAQDEAARKKADEERAAAAKRTGTSQTLLTQTADVSSLGTRRRSLLGGS